MHRTSRTIAVLLVVPTILWALHIALGNDGFRRRAALEAEVQRLVTAHDAMDVKVISLGGRIQAFRRRYEVQESVIRDRLGWVRPGDRLLVLPERDATP